MIATSDEPPFATGSFDYNAVQAALPLRMAAFTMTAGMKWSG